MAVRQLRVSIRPSKMRKMSSPASAAASTKCVTTSSAYWR